MKILAIIGFILIAGSNLFADADIKANIKPNIKVWVEGRADFLNQSSVALPNLGNVPNGTPTTANEQDFQMNRLRPNIGGNVTDDISYRVRLNFDKTDATLSRDGTPNLLEIAYVDDKWSDAFTLRMGKMPILEQNGWESVYQATDVFTYSTAFVTNNNLFGYYRTGGEARYTIAGQQFILAVTTPTQTLQDTTGINQTNYGLGYALFYQGSFLNGMIQPILAYSLYTLDGNVYASPPTGTVNDSLLAISARIVPIPDLWVDLTYQNLVQPWQPTTTTGNSSVTNTAIARVQYKYDKFVPFVNAFTDVFSATQNATQFNDKCIEGGLWYYPYKDVNFRYELVYTSLITNWDPSATTTTTTVSKVWAGFKFDFSI